MTNEYVVVVTASHSVIFANAWRSTAQHYFNRSQAALNSRSWRESTFCLDK